MIRFLAQHKVAPNMLMLLMIFGGGYALNKLNIQFFPNFNLDLITVTVKWTGASADDVEHDVVVPLEQALKTVDNVEELTSTTGRGSTTISLELKQGTDIVLALNQVKQKVDEFRNLPGDAELPQVFNVVRYEQIANVLISGPDDIGDLRKLANRFKRELLFRGIDKVDIGGLPDEEIAIEISTGRLQQLRMSLDQIGQRINAQSQNMPAGTFGEHENTKEVRGLGQRRDESGFAALEIVSDDRSRIELGAIARITRQPRSDGVTLGVNGKPAAELILRRMETGDTLKSAEILKQWLDETRSALPGSIKLHLYRERWKPINDRINILLKNGAWGLILVIGVLYLFLNARVAFWVAVGIPVSFMAALLMMYWAGGSINMVSLFGLIMTLGIIVDDAIVVGEDAYTHYQTGESPLEAAEGGATRMLAPVIASSLTTIAAFLPIIFISGSMGNIMFDIPFVVIAVILASLFESFLVLPGHLRNTFIHLASYRPSPFRMRFDQGFERFKYGYFRTLLESALKHRATTLSMALASLIVIAGLFAGGRINFIFFPTPESSVIHAKVIFAPGTPAGTVGKLLDHLEDTALQVDAEFSNQLLIETLVIRHRTNNTTADSGTVGNSNLGTLSLELVDSDLREMGNQEFIERWRNKIQNPAGLETLTIAARRFAPDSSTVTIRLTGDSAERVKAAAMDLRDRLRSESNLFNITDNMPYGKEQLIYRLTPAGTALGLTTAELGRQLRTAFDGKLVQIFQDGPDEVEVRIRLPETERNHLSALSGMEIYLDTGQAVPFNTVADLSTRTGFSVIRHAEGEIAVDVTASITGKRGDAGALMTRLERAVLPGIVQQYGVNYSSAGDTSDQVKTLSEMKFGVLFGLLSIYFVLAWVFSSYGWPLVVMSIIPFGLVGAVIGHLIMGLDVTIMSFLGFFGLSGIVVNDSIILVIFYRQLRDRGLGVREALVEAATRRIRAVLLTSLTTIAGLFPLLFETSLQAQFLIPMAVSIAFGLTLSTLVVLILVPVLLSLHEDLNAWVFS